jgi:hypothetical protein
MENHNYKWPFSIAMFVYQRVVMTVMMMKMVMMMVIVVTVMMIVNIRINKDSGHYEAYDNHHPHPRHRSAQTLQ